MLKKKKKKKQEGSHERLINRLKNLEKSNPPTEKELAIRTIGNVWNQGKPHRVGANYFFDRPFPKANAEELIGWAEKIQQLIQELEAQGTSKP